MQVASKQGYLAVDLKWFRPIFECQVPIVSLGTVNKVELVHPDVFGGWIGRLNENVVETSSPAYVDNGLANNRA